MGDNTDGRVDRVKRNADGGDRISDLPSFIIHQIMSYLSRKEVALTSVLSKRWNYLRTSFPIFDFDEIDFFRSELEMTMMTLERGGRFRERIESFVNFVDISLVRFCELKYSMQTFRLCISLVDVEGLSSFLDKWIGAAVENEVKELDVTIKADENKLYVLPQTIFSASLLTSLKLNGCKLEQPSAATRLFLLKKLELVRVHISEAVVQKLTSECILLEEFSFRHCWGLKNVCICKPDKLKILRIASISGDVERVKIDIPSLQQFHIGFNQQLWPCEIEMDECKHLKELHLACCILKDEEFHRLISKFPLLENLYVACCHFLERIMISSNLLKHLIIGTCGNLKAIDVDTPNLLSFEYHNNSVPISSINAPCPWIVRFVIGGEIDTNWCLNLKKFLGVSNQIKELTLYITSNKVSFDLEEFRKGSPSPPPEVGHVSLFPNVFPSDYEAFLEGLLRICYPKRLSIRAWEKDHNKFIESLCATLMNRNVNCCNSDDFKCWRHYLKGIKVESFLTLLNQQPIIIDDFMDVSILPRGTLWLSLDWCFHAPADKA